MKKKYKKPEMDLSIFDVENVITLSSNDFPPPTVEPPDDDGTETGFGPVMPPILP